MGILDNPFLCHWERRRFLKSVAAMSVAPLLTGCGDKNASNPAFLGWKGPPHVADVRMRLIGWASLAPSFYNLQPWKVALEGNDTLWLVADSKRARLHSDPLMRQVTLSQGTFLELLQLGALSEGWNSETTLFPEGPYDTARDMRVKPVARVALRRAFDLIPPSLFGSVRLRRTCRRPFLARAIFPKVRDDLLKQARSIPDVAVGWLDRGMDLERAKGIIVEALRRTCLNPALTREYMQHIRLTNAEVAQKRDGLMPFIPFPGEGIRFFYGTRAFSEPESWLNHWAFTQSVARVAETTGFVWIATHDNKRHDQVLAGRAYARLDLAAAASGLSLQPFSAPLTGHADVMPLQDSLQNLFAPGQTMHMIARVGYAGDVSPSPRRAAGELII